VRKRHILAVMGTHFKTVTANHIVVPTLAVAAIIVAAIMVAGPIMVAAIMVAVPIITGATGTDIGDRADVRSPCVPFMQNPPRWAGGPG
jgi:hypothetical protein